ncbi:MULTISPECIES: OFA family MFS transporter [Methylorubrum]|uniref:OFA family MFS transporter n=1 Tax=Methylorubrum TaxID=2282523 RepID=UPI0020A0F43A|nr:MULTISPECIES: OFA family MFS transporter [Methylorubrum]MCP1550340.1 MFS family permease [Methylorubrum zatmanii]MCP1553047.1 MFS family permease [Methylorubrum extorquens]MCP1580643.1 MFS family permease [Methylorubrum extorquens]
MSRGGVGDVPWDEPAPAFLSRERTVAKPGFNRWLVPPAALAIHLCIGMAYGLSVFWLPLSRALSVGAAAPAACPDMSVATALFTTTCDWRVSDLVIVFSIGIVMLGISAAVFGGWLERAGPRKAGLAAALCWSGGFLVGALGVYLHQLWLIWLGMGLIGGIGLGLGYISPVSTLIKWFPDRRGMATGMAIMGFGGGAMIGSPLADTLIKTFRSADTAGVWQALAVMGLGYLVFMVSGALGYRVPPAGWQPEGWTPPAAKNAMIASGHVHLDQAHKTPQFWLLWLVLCLNVSAGIGVLALASPMLQEIFGGGLIGRPGVALGQLDAAEKGQVAAIAAGFVGLLSLFNILGRFFWASMSDRIGRKTTYAIFFGVGLVLYAAAPWAAGLGSTALFVGMFCIILSMYGGGFATIPAYLADVFGTQFVGAIHGRLLTAWSTAGVVGPLVITAIRQHQVDAGVQGLDLYARTMLVLAGFLAAGFLCNLLVRPLARHWFMDEARVKSLQDKPSTAEARTSAAVRGGSQGIGRGGVTPGALLAWAVVGLPILWGIWITLSKALILFR